MMTRILLLISFLLLTIPAWGDELTLDAVLAELQQAASETQTLASHFRQEKRLEMFAETLVSQGRFVYQRPDRLRWELLSPVASGFVLQGERGVRWNGLSRERQAFSVAADPVMGMIAQQLLAWARVDLDWLQQRYRMELLTTAPVSLRLHPRDPGEAGFIDYLQIQFAEDRRHLTAVLLQEQGGDSTRLQFEQVAINQPLPEDAFAAPEF